MLANILAFIAAIIIGIVIAIAGGGEIHPVVTFIVMIVCFGVANLVNKQLRHSPRGEAQSPVMVKPAPESSETATETSQSPPATPPQAAMAPTSPSPTTQTPPNAVGQVVDGKLMITEEEVRQVLRSPDDYHNVIAFAKPPGSPANMQPQAWFLALSPNSGIFFNEGGTEIWSVTPDGVDIPEAASGVRIPRWGWPTIRSVDGRKQTVPIDSFNATVLKAWKAASRDEYIRQSAPWCSLWGLLAYELFTGKMVSRFLRWQPTYGTLTQGIEMLSTSPDELKTVANIACRWHAGDAMLKTARQLQLGDDHPLISAIASAKQAVLKRNIAILVAVIVVGLLLVSAVNVMSGAW